MPAQRKHNTRSKKLSVAADATTPPTLAVIAPTPRAFTFPPNQNLSESPSSTTFDGDLRDSLSPVSSYSPSPFSRSGKWSPSLDGERRPQKGDKDYIKRPPNAFFLFRRQCCEDRQSVDTKKARQAELSKTISQRWKSLPAAERKHWEDLALQKKREHERMYPDYVYRPQRLRDDNGKLIRRTKDDSCGDVSTAKTLSVAIPKRKATFAPGPPLPYHTIQVPNVYVAEIPTDSSSANNVPASPSSLSMLRRSSHPGHTSNVNYGSDDIASMSFAFGAQPSEFLTGLLERPSNEVDVQFWSAGSPSMLLPGLELDSSVGSCSPGPFSPAFDPPTPISDSFFSTPTSSVFADSFSQFWGASSGYDGQVHAEDMFGQGFIKFEEFSPYTWSGGYVEESVSPTSWPSNSQLTFNSDDFDIESIPPLELGGQNNMDHND
ncbi:hypothetical protein C8J56DRAFT_203201 [Mycena floridula]|nr:hypothetical protein C8J56DRAFT_203201 [Mycena floridula]